MFTKKHYAKFIVALSTIGEKQNNQMSMSCWVNPVWSVHMVECNLALKRNALIHATTWMGLENIFGGRSQLQTTARDVIPLL